MPTAARPALDAPHAAVTNFFWDLSILCAGYRKRQGGTGDLKNVVFDLGGVLIDWNPERILAGFYADPDSRAIMRTALFMHPDWLQLDRGTLQEAELLARVAGRTGRPHTELEDLLEAVRASLHAKSDTVALLEQLAARGVPLYCLSNISADMFGYLRRRHSFWSLFRGIVISGELQLMKPEREIFELLLKRYDLAAQDTVFVDDNGPNVAGARAVGVHGVWFRDAAQCERELEELISSD